MAERNPESRARANIDAQLAEAGWVVQDYARVDLSAGRGIALRETPMKSGSADYLLLVDRRAVGVIEAKKEGERLSGVAEQSSNYAENLPAFIEAAGPGRLPFVYESTGVETFFRDMRDPEPRSREVFWFHRPETLAEWVAQPNTLRARLRRLPPLISNGMRVCQIEAITSLERSFAEDHPRALIQMATGSGKTFAAVSSVYRLIKHAGARRVLFLVDRNNLGRQTVAEFQQYVLPDTGRKFTEVYNIQHLASASVDPVARVVVSTIQRLYSVLRGEELDEDLDEKSGFEVSAALLQSGSGVPPLVELEGTERSDSSSNNNNKRRDGASTFNSSNGNKRRDGASTFSSTPNSTLLPSRPLEVVYNPAVPIETFDFIITDECHRSIYDLWRQVLDYFDAHLIGLTATPSKQTIAFFNQNLVMEYGHDRAVADGVNVGYEVYRIRTQVTEQGATTVEKGFFIDRRSKETRARRWERLDEDLTYSERDLDRSVVVPSQIRTVLQTLKEAYFTELFPGRALVPKTLIFAKDDSHAEDIVHICREVFGRGNDFCKKITYKSWNAETRRYEKSETLIQELRTSPQLRIAVTVDMIATGTDIKPLECLVFLRDVRSRVYFEQMKGRGTRVLSPTDLQAVSGPEALAKTHFVVVDAVGVCESDKTDSRPLERHPCVSFEKLLLGVALGKRDEDTLTTLAGRLARLEREVSREDAKTLTTLAGGKTLGELASGLLQAVDPDIVEAASRRLLNEDFLAAEEPEDYSVCPFGYFDPEAPVVDLSGNLPHWRQEGVTYFVTFRLSDALPQEKLNLWRREMQQWLAAHPEPHDEATRKDFYNRFPARMQRWLDAGYGSCVLALPQARTIVEDALRHFHGTRYGLDEFVVASNHVHAIVTPFRGHDLSDILHSWKSFTAHEILKVDAAARRLREHQEKVEAASRRLAGRDGQEEREDKRRDGASTFKSDSSNKRRDGASTLSSSGSNKRRDGASTIHVWQKESFDHIVRSPASLEKFRSYIRNHFAHQGDAIRRTDDNLRRDAAATLTAEACAPFDKPDLRDSLVRIKKNAEQIIDTVTLDVVTERGFDAAAKQQAADLVRSFRDYIEQHKAEIEALQILYSRPYRQRLTEETLKDLEAKLRQEPQFGPDPVPRLWRAFEMAESSRSVETSKVSSRVEEPSRLLDVAGKMVGKVEEPSRVLKASNKRRDAASTFTIHRFTDLVSLVRAAIAPGAALETFESHVRARFAEWLDVKAADGVSFTADELRWLERMRDCIAASGSVDREHFELANELGQAYQVFGERLWPIMDELNRRLVA